MNIEEKEDLSHKWVWDLKIGDKVWVAIEESIAQSERYHIEFLEQSGPSEYIGVDEIFVPYEMEVVNNWSLKNGAEESHIIAFEFTDPRKYHRLKFAYQNNTRDLQNLFGRIVDSDIVVSTRTFRTKAECEAFCNHAIVMHYTTDMCDSVIKELNHMIERVKSVRTICANEENFSG